MWDKTIYRSAFIILFSGILIAGIASCKDIAFNNPLDPNASRAALKVDRVVETPLAGRGDITFDGEKFWKINAMGTLNAFDRESGTLIRSFSTPAGTGVAILKNNIYVCNGQGNNILYVIEPLSGEPVRDVPTQELYPGFICTSGDRLILYDTRSSGVFEYDPETGDSQRLFELSGFTLGGMDVFRDGLLVTDTATDSIYRFSLSGQVLDSFSSPAPGVGGIAVDGSDYIYLFMMDGNLYKVSLP